MDKQITVSQILEEIAAKICDEYCKYPDQWNEEKNGPLCESDVCVNCPLSLMG